MKATNVLIINTDSHYSQSKEMLKFNVSQMMALGDELYIQGSKKACEIYTKAVVSRNMNKRLKLYTGMSRFSSSLSSGEREHFFRQ